MPYIPLHGLIKIHFSYNKKIYLSFYFGIKINLGLIAKYTLISFAVEVVSVSEIPFFILFYF